MAASRRDSGAIALRSRDFTLGGGRARRSVRFQGHMVGFSGAAPYRLPVGGRRAGADGARRRLPPVRAAFAPRGVLEEAARRALTS